MRIAESTVDIWRKLESAYLSEGGSRKRAHARIAEEFGVSASTVYLRLTPGALRQREERARERLQDPSYAAARGEVIRSAQARYRASDAERSRNRSYQAKYGAVYRHLRSWETEFEDYDADQRAGLVARKVLEVTGIAMAPGTVARRLGRPR